MNRPYLSVVATARNDNHGGDLLHRMQVFVNGLASQAHRHRISIELIIVDWNPPLDRPPLRDALVWPAASDHFVARIIEVPRELHRTLAHSERLPLFQMIAKNVGIRRAHGDFVLATNVDLVLSDELFTYIAQRRLRPGRLYRVDRFDVDPTLDPWSEFEEQQAACARSVIRICRRQGTEDLRTGEFFRIYDDTGWLAHSLALRLAQGRSGAAGHVLRRIAFVQRLLKVIVIRTLLKIAAWGAAAARFFADAVLGAVELAIRSARTLPRLRHPRRAKRRLRAELRWLRGRVVARARRAGLRRDDARVRTARFAFLGPMVVVVRQLVADIQDAVLGLRLRRKSLAIRFALLHAAWESDRARLRLHTNACGDFTLLAREDWRRTRAYPELQIFSMHLDSLFLYQAHYTGIRERFLTFPIYHLEHGGGFKPDDAGLRQLNERLERDAIPQVSNEEFLAWALEMMRTKRPLSFNADDWGFAAQKLPEAVIGARRSDARPASEVAV